MSGWVDPELMRPLGWALIHFLWQGALIAGAVALVSLAVKRASARYVLFCIGLALMAASPVVTALWVHQDSARPLDFMLAPSMAAGAEEPWIPWLTGVWITGVAVCVLRLVIGCIQVQKLRRMAADRLPKEWADRVRELSERVGVRQKVRMLIVDRLDVPATIGTVRALILMPACALARLSNDQLEALIAHELAHIKRYDYLVNLVQSFIEAVLFYHPAVWWISKQIRNEREHACDDIAVGAVGDALVYARALERLETIRSSPAPSLAMAVNGGSVCDRIRRLIGLPTQTRQRLPATPFVALALGALALVAVSARAVAASTEAATSKAQKGLMDPERGVLAELSEVSVTDVPMDRSPAIPPQAPFKVRIVQGKQPHSTSAKVEKTSKTASVFLAHGLEFKTPSLLHEVRKVEQVRKNGTENYTFQVITDDLSADDFLAPGDGDFDEIRDVRFVSAPAAPAGPVTLPRGEQNKVVWMAPSTHSLRSTFVYTHADRPDAVATTLRVFGKSEDFRKVTLELAKTQTLINSEVHAALKLQMTNMPIAGDKVGIPFMGKVSFQGAKGFPVFAKGRTMSMGGLTSAKEAEKWAKISESYEKAMKQADWAKAEKAWVESSVYRERADKMQVLGRRAERDLPLPASEPSATGQSAPAKGPESGGH